MTNVEQVRAIPLEHTSRLKLVRPHDVLQALHEALDECEAKGLIYPPTVVMDEIQVRVKADVHEIEINGEQDK